MVIVVSFQNTTLGKIYYNDFTTTDGTSKNGTQTWVLNTGAAGPASYLNATSANQGTFYVPSSSPYSAVFSNINSPSGGLVGLSATNQGTADTTYGGAVYSNTNLKIVKYVNGTETDLASSTIAVGAFNFTQFYPCQFLSQPLLLKWSVKGFTTLTLTGDTSLTTGSNAGGTAYGGCEWDYILVTSSDTITINGLLDGQKFSIYQGGTLINTSIGSTSGKVTSPSVIGIYPNPPYDQIIITDTDGVTPIYTYTNTAGIYPGDVYTAIAVSNTLTNPPYVPPLRTQKARVYFYTKHKVYRDIILATVSPPSGNTLGSFKFLIPDLNRSEETNFSRFENVWIVGKSGVYGGRVMRGIVDLTTPVRMPNGYWALQVEGRDMGAYLDIRRFNAEYTWSNVELSTIIKDATNGIASIVPELVFGDYILYTGVVVTQYTIPYGMSAMDALRELTALATTPGVQWQAFCDFGEYPGDNGAPNVHFTPITQNLSLIPLNTLNAYRVTAPRDYRQVMTVITMGIDNGCFSDDTEVLTDNGWKLFDRLHIDDYVATLNPHGTVEYNKPNRYIKYHYIGKMYSVISDKLDLLVTPNHNMVIFKDNNEPIISRIEQLQPSYSYLTDKGFSKPEKPSWVNYNGFVYDVTVDNHTLLVRRNGKVCWSGNSGGNLPNAYVTVKGYGPGVNSLYSGQFNGTSSYVTIPHAAQLNFGS